MEWIDTPDSSNLRRFRYDESSQILTVEFKNGTLYSYYDVPEWVYAGLVDANSRGSYLARTVKGSYRYARI